MKIQLYSDSEQKTKEIATKFCTVLDKGDTIGLSGDLGAGKTMFIKACGNFFGIAEDDITSTSFVLAREYVGRIPFLHADVYRICDYCEMPVEVSEFVSSKKGIAFIEWYQNIEIVPEYVVSLCQSRLEERIIEIETLNQEKLLKLKSELGKYRLKL